MGMVENNLSSASITSNLETQFIGQRVIYYPKLASTMDIAKREARRGAVEGTVIIAGEQSAGRGRIKRTWLTPEGGIALSIILRPGVHYLPSLIMLTSLAVVRSLRKVTGLESQIKWPNDVLINGRKVCGVLVESEVQGDTVSYANIGIGINANFRVSDFPEIPSTATSLSDELERDVSRLEIIRCFLVEVEKLYLTLPGGGAVYEEWRDSLVTLGREVQVKWEGNIVCEGVAESVARDGSLLLRLSDGTLKKIVAGDVTLRA